MTLLRVAARSLFAVRPHRHAMRRVAFEPVSRPSTLTGRIAAFHQSSIRQATIEERVKKIVAEQLGVKEEEASSTFPDSQRWKTLIRLPGRLPTRRASSRTWVQTAWVPLNL
jgi:hypothetical protein